MGRREQTLDTPDAQGTADLLAPLASAQEADVLAPLLRERTARLQSNSLPGVVTGTLVAIAETGRSPLVLCAGSTAAYARSVVDLRGEHVGQTVVLSFENGDPALPIVMGVLHDESHRGLNAPGLVELEQDGERMVVSAREQLVLRCGEASITLTKAGKVLIEGNYVSSRSTGVNRVKGGSIQLN